MINKKDSKSKLLASVTQEIIDISKTPGTKVEPKFNARGFWTIPSAVIVNNTKPQEIVQFRVQYRYLTIDGRETSLDTYKLEGTDSNEARQKTAIYSAWNEYLSDVRKRVYDKGWFHFL